MTDRLRANRRSRGFTLVESIAVILVIGVLAAISAVFVVQPFTAARDMTRRAELVDAAETALNRMTREIRLAVPNSVRIQGQTLEFLRSSTGGRYRRLQSSGGGDNVLDPTQSSGTFDVLGGLPGEVTVGTAGRACADETNNIRDCIVINNTATTGFDAYAENNVAAITAADGNTAQDAEVAGPQTLRFDTADGTAAFPAHSSNQRFQVFDTVVSYHCTGSRINRHHDYGLNAGQVAPPTGGTQNLLARDVTACTFDYDSGAGQRHGLVTIDLTLQRDPDGETVRLVDQAHVVNVP